MWFTVGFSLQSKDKLQVTEWGFFAEWFQLMVTSQSRLMISERDWEHPNGFETWSTRFFATSYGEYHPKLEPVVSTILFVLELVLLPLKISGFHWWYGGFQALIIKNFLSWAIKEFQWLFEQKKKKKSFLYLVVHKFYSLWIKFINIGYKKILA